MIISIVTKQNVTEWEITKTEVGEKEIFLTLTKYNTCQRREKGKPQLMMNFLITMINPLHNSVQRIYEE